MARQGFLQKSYKYNKYYGIVHPGAQEILVDGGKSNFVFLRFKDRRQLHERSYKA